MSMACRTVRDPLLGLSPRFVHFTPTKGVLRCMNAGEELDQAQGLIFVCPRCSKDKTKRHYSIFLFKNAPETARPLGRFTMFPNHPPGQKITSKIFSEIGLVEENNPHMLIRPREVECGWIGHLLRGEVTWKPGGPH